MVNSLMLSFSVSNEHFVELNGFTELLLDQKQSDN